MRGGEAVRRHAVGAHGGRVQVGRQRDVRGQVPGRYTTLPSTPTRVVSHYPGSAILESFLVLIDRNYKRNVDLTVRFITISRKFNIKLFFLIFISSYFIN